jgi:hypothetical protein
MSLETRGQNLYIECEGSFAPPGVLRSTEFAGRSLRLVAIQRDRDLHCVCDRVGRIYFRVLGPPGFVSCKYCNFHKDCACTLVKRQIMKGLVSAQILIRSAPPRTSQVCKGKGLPQEAMKARGRYRCTHF